MFSHPILSFTLLACFFSVLNFAFSRPLSFLRAFSVFLHFPLWVLLLICLLFSVVNSVRNSWYYRLLNTRYHEHRTVPVHPTLPRLPFVTASDIVASEETDITAARLHPINSPAPPPYTRNV